jgi:3'(2'), 5'-bisphosphate nucleotidase
MPDQGVNVIDFDFLRRLTAEAAKAILEVYATDFTVECKEDHSPVTLADRRSHEIITRGLKEKYPDIPILSEEGMAIPYEIRKDWPRFWLVDPLDGTKEFVRKEEEFAINIALIEGNAPVLGVIAIPVEGTFYEGSVGVGCWETGRNGRREVKVRGLSTDRPVRVVKSRSHPSPNMSSILELVPSREVLRIGSAVKFCRMAAGEADFYPRLGPTYEWDTAAGQALIVAAGGTMVDPEGKVLLYNKPSLLNGPFFAAANVEWLESLGILAKARTLDGY